jgi:hypothetical protein
MNKSKINALIEKARAGKQITAEELENLIAKRDPTSRPAKVCSPKHAIAKAKKGVKLNNWEIEEIAKSPEHAVEWADLTGRCFPPCEEILLEKGSSEDITHYFFNIVKVPSKPFEKWLIEEDGKEYIGKYINDVLKSRWEEGEDALLKITHRWVRGELDLDYALAHQKNFKIGYWAKLEKILLNGKVRVSDRASSIESYFMNCGPGRNDAVERRLLKYGNAGAIFLYARHCVGGKLPDGLHNRMILSGKKSAKKYISWLASKKKSMLRYLVSISEEDRAGLLGLIPETV